MSEEVPFFPFSKDPYKVLGISHRATAEEIKEVYFSLIKKYSPEKKPEEFKRIRAAYEQIRSQKKREETDFMLFDEGDISPDYQEIKGHFYNIWDDVLAIELWLSANKAMEKR